MDLNAAEQLVKELLFEHKLYRFNFKWSRSTSNAGMCIKSRMSDTQSIEYRQGTIQLSSIYVKAWDESVVRETILHEIAHALTPTTVSAHGPEWRATALAIGSNGRRCVDAKDRIEINEITHKYISYCAKGHSTTQARKRSRNYSCPTCFPSKFNSDYLLTQVANTADNRAMIAALKDRNTVVPLTPRKVDTVAVAAKTAVAKNVSVQKKPSRAAEYDAGTAFINWD